jgi:type IV pilus assembly protein PilN
MIRINLLGVERQRVRKAAAFDVGQRLTLACSLILVATALGLGWWYWTLNEASARVDTEIAAARTEQARLASLLLEVQEFEARRTQLRQRVALIDQLRSGQSLPVQLLDHVSRSLPDLLWLTDLEQTADAVTIQGRSTTVPALSDFVSNLGSSALFQKPIELVDSAVEAVPPAPGQAAVEVVRFTVRAQMAPPAPPAGPVAAVPAGGAP